MDAVGKVVPGGLDGGRAGRARHDRSGLPVYDSPDWAKGYDIVVHNECFADITDPAFIRKITAAHKSGPPAIVIHCAMHTFRAATIDDWREFLGVTRPPPHQAVQHPGEDQSPRTTRS